MAKRVKLTTEQLIEYYDRLDVPVDLRCYSVKSLTDDEQLHLLATIIKHQIVRVPFENLVLHYSWHRVINPNQQHSFRKIVQQAGRGGYCMEVNSLLHAFLFSLDFKCYIAPSRVINGEWTSFSHIVILVTIGGAKYLCDVGFGNNEPLQPVKIEHGQIADQIRPTQIRLVYEDIPEHLSDNKMWVMQSRMDQSDDWKPMYCFSEMEVLPADIVSLNYEPWQAPNSSFRRHVICVRYTVGDDPEYDKVHRDSNVYLNEIDGILIINDSQLKWRRNGKTVMEKTLESEQERVEALRTYWGITLDDLDIGGIHGSATAIVASKS